MAFTSFKLQVGSIPQRNPATEPGDAGTDLQMHSIMTPRTASAMQHTMTTSIVSA